MENGPVRVLLIDDDEDDYLLTRDLLADIGRDRYDLQWAATYEAGVEAFRSGEYDVCLVDYQLGKHSGLELLTQETRSDSPIPVIVLTGAGDRSVDMAAMEAGAADYLDKSELTGPLLERSIRYAIAQARARQALIEKSALLEAEKQKAEVASRAKSQFLANMSHELRTPLNAIIGFSEVIRDELFGPVGHPNYREYIDDIRDSADHLLSVINDILDVSKLGAGKIELQEGPVDVAKLISSAIRIVHGQAEKVDVAITQKVPPGLPRLMADERRLKQMLLNLLSNALKFSRPGGRVTVEATNEPRGLVIKVADTGIGMAPEDIPKALTPFGQVESDLNKAFVGTGLGLPLTKGLVELHGGTLEIESAVGAGTTVTLTFPARRLIHDAGSPPRDSAASVPASAEPAPPHHP